MIREQRKVGFYIPDNMRVAVYVPSYCTLVETPGEENLTLKNAHKIYEPGTRMPEMNLMLMHTANDQELFAVEEVKRFHHYITANGQPLRTSHFPELVRYEPHKFHKKPNNIAYRHVTLSQFLSMILNRYGEERMITVKVIACRSDSTNEFKIQHNAKRKKTRLNMKYWNDDDENNQAAQRRVLKRMKRSGDKENQEFAERVKKQLQQNGTQKNKHKRTIRSIYGESRVNKEFDEWINNFGKRRPVNYNSNN